MLVAPRSVPVTAVFEYGLVDRLQRPLGRFLHALVFQTADPKRPTLPATRLRYVTPLLRPRTIPHPLQPPRQVPKVLFDVLPVFSLGYAIHSSRLIGSS